MKEENNTPKSKWSRIYRKKWFFPALYLAIATILLSVVVWYQNVGQQIPEAEKDVKQGEDYVPNPFNEDAEAVVDQQEVIKMPVKDKNQTEIVTKFYDYNAEQEDQENALVLYNNRYYQSTGIDIAADDGEAFEVIASLSGTVTEVKEDPLLGNVVVMDHDNDVMTYYASLQDVEVKAGDKVKQGDRLGVAGKNLFGKDHGTHVHFEIRKDGKEVDPESYFDQPMSKLDEVDAEEATEEQADEEKEDSEKGDSAEKEKSDDEEAVEKESEESTPSHADEVEHDSSEEEVDQQVGEDDEADEQLDEQLNKEEENPLSR
ncbi:MAG TPA: peptidoglycan DD-metalloendopeptidase family protein [Bacillota bacterium]